MCLTSTNKNKPDENKFYLRFSGLKITYVANKRTCLFDKVDP